MFVITVKQKHSISENQDEGGTFELRWAQELGQHGGLLFLAGGSLNCEHRLSLSNTDGWSVHPINRRHEHGRFSTSEPTKSSHQMLWRKQSSCDWSKTRSITSLNHTWFLLKWSHEFVCDVPNHSITREIGETTWGKISKSDFKIGTFVRLNDDFFSTFKTFWNIISQIKSYRRLWTPTNTEPPCLIHRLLM